MDPRVVIVTDADRERGAALARALGGSRDAILLAGSDATALGALAAELGAAGARVAVFVDDPATETGRAALTEMVNELFPAPH